MKELYDALSQFQAELVTVSKSSSNPFYKSKYAPLDEMMKAAQPILTKYGLAVIQLPSHLDGRPALRTIIAHNSGQSVEDTAPLILTKDDPQAQGSAITYMRRYAYTAGLGIVIDEDDDGNATKPITRHSTAQEPDDPWATAPPVEAAGKPVMATSAQIRLIQVLLGKAGIKDRAEQYDKLSLIIDRTVTSGKQLTSADASLIISDLKAETETP